MSPKSVFITGCNRGIGLELARQYLGQKNPPHHVFATYRTMSDDLKKLADENSSLKLIQLDVSNYSSFPGIVKQVEAVVGNEGLNLLINNAGYMPPNRDLATTTPEDMRQAYEINCIAPFFFTKAMLPLLECAAKASSDSGLSVDRAAVIQMSSSVGSIAENSWGTMHAYRCSKTGLNQAMKTMSIDLKDTGVLTMSIHPGWVKTDMGGANAALTTAESCTMMINTLAQLSTKDYASFLNFDGKKIDW